MKCILKKILLTLFIPLLLSCTYVTKSIFYIDNNTDSTLFLKLYTKDPGEDVIVSELAPFTETLIYVHSGLSTSTGKAVPLPGPLWIKSSLIFEMVLYKLNVNYLKPIKSFVLTKTYQTVLKINFHQ